MTSRLDGKDLRWTHFPYCLQRLADGRYVVLNRDYKPLGMAEEDYVRYEDHPVIWEIKGLTPLRASKISYSGSEGLSRIYLYNDGCVPTQSAAAMTAYAKRLAVLMKLTVVNGD